MKKSNFIFAIKPLNYLSRWLKLSIIDSKIIQVGIAFCTMFFLAPLLGGVGGGLLSSLTGGAGVGFAQNNALILSGAYTVLNGGTSSTPVYLVIEQSSTLGIVRTGGHIISEGQYNYIKWNAGTATGNYVFPFGVDGDPAKYIPFTFNKTTAGSSSISMSTWTTNQQNMPHPGISNVAAVSSMTCTADSVNSAIDRFWDIQASATANLTFSYLGSENTTTIAPTDTFKAQHWNGILWQAQAGPGNPGVTAGIGTVGPITGQSTFSPWVLTSALRVTASAIPATICSGSSVQLNATPIGGSGTYTYSWSSIPAGFTSSLANPNVSPTVNTIYYVTVTNCSTNATGSVSVTVNALPTATITSSTNPSACGASDGSATAGGGTSYIWNTLPPQNTATATGLISGTYTVTVSDGTCSSSTSITLTDPSAPTVTLNADNTTICAGSSVTFTAGGATDYEFFINGISQGAPSPVNVFTTSSLLNGDVVNVYGTTTGCTGSSSTITLVVNDLPTVNLGPDVSQCGDTVTLDAANAGSTYLWSDNSTAQTLLVSATGIYSVTVTNTNGCTATDTIDVTINALPVVNLGSDITQCGTATLDAGNAGSTYSWSDSSTNQTLLVSATGTYSVTVTNTNSCTATDTVNVTINASPTVNLGSDVTQCGGTVNLDAANAGSTYLWSDNSTAQTLLVSATGLYAVTVTNTNGCTGIDTVNVTINA